MLRTSDSESPNLLMSGQQTSMAPWIMSPGVFESYFFNSDGTKFVQFLKLKDVPEEL